MVVKREHGAKIILVASLLIAALCLPSISRGEQRSLELSYSVTVKDIPENAGKASIWIPLPRSNTVQNLVNFQISDDIPYTILTDKEFNNKYLYFRLPCGQAKESEISLTAVFQVRD